MCCICFWVTIAVLGIIFKARNVRLDIIKITGPYLPWASVILGSKYANYFSGTNSSSRIKGTSYLCSGRLNLWQVWLIFLLLVYGTSLTTDYFLSIFYRVCYELRIGLLGGVFGLHIYVLTTLVTTRLDITDDRCVKPFSTHRAWFRTSLASTRDVLGRLMGLRFFFFFLTGGTT